MIIKDSINEKDSLFFCYAVNGYITTKACRALCMLYSNCGIITNALNEIKDCDAGEKENIQVLRIGRSRGFYQTELKAIEQRGANLADKSL